MGYSPKYLNYQLSTILIFEWIDSFELWLFINPELLEGMFMQDI